METVSEVLAVHNAAKEQLESAKKRFVEIKNGRFTDKQYTEELAIFLKSERAYHDEIKKDEQRGFYVVYKGQKVQKKFDRQMFESAYPKHLFIDKMNRKTLKDITRVLGEAPLFVPGAPYAHIGIVTAIEEYKEQRKNKRIEKVPFYKIYFTKTSPQMQAPDDYYKMLIETTGYKQKLTALLAFGFEPTTPTVETGLVLCRKLVNMTEKTEDIAKN
jgi:hypothetical protein